MGIPFAALAAALLAAACAAPNEAPPPPIAELEAQRQIAPVLTDAEEPAPATTSIAALGLRGSSTPAGGMSIASAGRASVSEGAEEISISYPPTDELSLDALLTSLTDDAPSEPVAEAIEVAEHDVAEEIEPAPTMAAAEPAVEAPSPVEPAVEHESGPFEMTALVVASPTYPLTPSEIVREHAIEPAPKPVMLDVVADKPDAPEAESAPMKLAAFEAPAQRPMPAPELIAAPAAEPLPSAPAGPPTLEDLYTCDYAPAQRMGGVQLVSCR